MPQVVSDVSYEGVVPCTLYSGHYHYGAGALVNSLYCNGFRGTMCIGYLPPLPPWTAGMRRMGQPDIFEVTEGFKVHFIPCPTDRNLSLEKPTFILHILDEIFPNASGALFFDADVIVHGEWSFFEDWSSHGVALCLDSCYPLVPSGHPWRRGWRDLAGEAGYNNFRDLEYYVNSGFIGVARAQRETVKCWAAMIEAFVRGQGTVANAVKFTTRDKPFVGDQDFLNAALMATSDPLSLIGQEAMDFAPAGYTMAHAVDVTKPWAKNYIGLALAGSPPGMADKIYWQYCDSPIQIFSPLRIRSTRIAMKLASAMGRFHSRK